VIVVLAATLSFTSARSVLKTLLVLAANAPNEAKRQRLTALHKRTAKIVKLVGPSAAQVRVRSLVDALSSVPVVCSLLIVID
jgi:hypothetical protein